MLYFLLGCFVGSLLVNLLHEWPMVGYIMSFSVIILTIFFAIGATLK